MIENLSPGGGGGDAGVVGFTPSQNTAAPNNTVNASRLLVDAASTNADAVVQPKGTGALLAQLPDGATTGGNKRGARAVDLQTSRSTAAQVASGESAFIGSGAFNTASGLRSAVVAGAANTASATDSAAFGNGCTASGNQSLAIGNGARADRHYMLAHGSYAFGAVGASQREEYVLGRTTTDATTTQLTCDGGLPSAETRINIDDDSAYVFSALVVGRATATNDVSAGYKIEGVIDRNAGTVAFVGTPVVTVLAEDNAAWDCAAAVDNTNKALLINVTGVAATNIRWVASVRLVKVTG